MKLMQEIERKYKKNMPVFVNSWTQQKSTAQLELMTNTSKTLLLLTKAFTQKYPYFLENKN